MTWLTERTGHMIVLDEMRYAYRQYPDLGEFSRGRLDLRQLLDPMMFELSTAVLSERLPTERVTRTRREQIETARFATWWDHFKATYRGRWWMRWRRWAVRQLVDTHEIEAVAAVDLDRHWTFPRAAIAAPELGDPVRVMQWSNAQVTQPNAVVTRAAADQVER
ncbi:hypothetical protein [Micromonospora maritima]|uniref:hypothetical protein n=1 Tax=Micromonospora maritima TaxID=986711 RepID=UPI00157CC18E|nr:hypothetical protein [Micromonospora maritima]